MKSLDPARAVVVSAVLSFAMAGCTQAVQSRQPATFFPAAPDLPRIQYLARFSGVRDIHEQSGFNRFIVGEEPNRHLDKPYGVAMHGSKIYVCDTNSTVTVFDLEGKTYSVLKGATGSGQLRQPVNISITADGTKYVADPVRGQVVAFDGNDEFLTAYGTPAEWKPVDAVAFGAELFVADMEKGRVVVIDPKTGAVLRSIGDTGEPTKRLGRPGNLAFDSQGNLFVSDVARFQVVEFDREGRFVKTIGTLGDGPGHFSRPKGIAVDRGGLLYAVDAAFNNVQIFTPEGRLAMFFGGPGANAGNMKLPAKVSIDYDDVASFRKFIEPGFAVEYLVLVTSQFAEPRVDVFAYGRQEGKHYPTDAELLGQIEAEKAKALGGAKAP